MACTYFIAEPACRCTAVAGLVVPSVYERERFCRGNDGFVRCPTFRAQSARGHLSVDDYYALWLPDAAREESLP